MREIQGGLDGRGKRFAIVVARFNDLVTRRLLEGARDALVRHGVGDDDITAVWVPGAREMTLPCKRLAASGSFDAVVCLGAVVRGETAHFDYVAGDISSGASAVAAETGVPVAFGVLTTDTMEQALDRAGGKAGNKGAEAAVAALEMVNVLDALGSL